MKKLIIFLIRRKMGLKLFQGFQFDNQKSTAVYYFTPTCLMKAYNNEIIPSHVSLNWLLCDKCGINRLKYYENKE